MNRIQNLIFVIMQKDTEIKNLKQEFKSFWEHHEVQTKELELKIKTLERKLNSKKI